jgi:hypothetical protein
MFLTHSGRVSYPPATGFRPEQIVSPLGAPVSILQTWAAVSIEVSFATRHKLDEKWENALYF